MITLDIRGLDKLQEAFAKLDGQFDRTMQLIAMGVGQEVKNEAQRYPARKSIPLSSIGGFASDKQRRWFFAALRSGQIEVPYRRTRNLGNRWHVQRHGQTGAVVGNPVPYAPFVHSPEQQSTMMAAIGWPTTEDIAEEVERSGAIERVAQKVVGRVLGMLGL